MKPVEVDQDIRKEYQNQKRYLENSVGSLRKRLEKETAVHKDDNLQIMQENIALISQITSIREKVKEQDTILKGLGNNKGIQDIEQISKS